MTEIGRLHRALHDFRRPKPMPKKKAKREEILRRREEQRQALTARRDALVESIDQIDPDDRADALDGSESALHELMHCEELTP